ncbi:MAG TPA: FAD:protein FMN transferase [Ramlibacter sp.]|uniref:FAD:protein FMN transferase n=1 Tax=Ramlibacter sp. TaxID=1917967 RepID=UPI002BB1CB19|nr:FAD:protein FMN transferase [Ramlibacter sp.]HVZ44483.1 FAD:protein FMN transferase [Ramlibacter sp.]
MQTRSDVLRRAKPLLGTIVSIEVVAGERGRSGAMDAIADAFAAVQTIHHAMSAHSTDSDLARLARAAPGSTVPVDRHTCAVLGAAQYWTSASAHAFDPLRAARRLARPGLRDGLMRASHGSGSLAALRIVDDTSVVPDGALPLDLGGIAKGYAVDAAVEILRSRGVDSALVNAGGDLRAFGRRQWTLHLRHPSTASLAKRLLRLKEGAVATSVRGEDFVPKRRLAPGWQCACVLAPDCMTADALTKWALQADEPCFALRRALRIHRARLVRW